MVKELDKHRDKIEQYEAFCDELGEDPANVGLAWLLHQKVVTAPIIGPRTLDQLDGTTRALEIKLDEKALARLDEIFPRSTPRSSPVSVSEPSIISSNRVMRSARIVASRVAASGLWQMTNRSCALTFTSLTRMLPAMSV
ncbi:aldo/keto reductase [Streptosporangium canum]